MNRIKPEYTSITESQKHELQSRKNEVCEDLLNIISSIIASMGKDTLEEVSQK